MEERFKERVRGREYVRKSGQRRKLLVNILAERDVLIRKNTLSEGEV